LSKLIAVNKTAPKPGVGLKIEESYFYSKNVLNETLKVMGDERTNLVLVSG
jgi:hypothetical protein